MYSARILLADDHPLVLEGVKQLLEPDFLVVGTVQTGQQVLEQAQKLQPDIVLLDANMPGMNGFEAARKLKTLLPAVKIIFVTMLTEAIAVSEGFRAGAMGYVLKQDASDELHAAVKSVMANRRFVSSKLDMEVREAMECQWSRPEGYTTNLTERQRQILAMLANGSSTKHIAKELNISMKTVEFHKANITRKLGVRTTSDLIRVALSSGMTAL
ncbi:MAG: response regulator transcription factor [Nitrospira sp.]|jgi:DNA-binding NarL/FixJ family response regulator|nr:response regulator transcription factor [Nitrospira sp.]MDI3463919.1 Two-component transcriptional response regulator, LuxR family [Nitrospira sp.]